MPTMPAQRPMMGMTVIYKLTKDDVDYVHRRRMEIGDQVSFKGTQLHIGNRVKEGDEFPCMIVRVLSDGADDFVNGQVFLDGNDVLWVIGVKRGRLAGEWRWLEI